MIFVILGRSPMAPQSSKGPLDNPSLAIDLEGTFSALDDDQVLALTSRDLGGEFLAFMSAIGNDAADRRPKRGHYALNAKGNFRFDRLIEGWRDKPVLDLRRKR